jgi:hypothetical protein
LSTKASKSFSSSPALHNLPQLDWTTVEERAMQAPPHRAQRGSSSRTRRAAPPSHTTSQFAALFVNLAEVDARQHQPVPSHQLSSIQGHHRDTCPASHGSLSTIHQTNPSQIHKPLGIKMDIGLPNFNSPSQTGLTLCTSYQPATTIKSLHCETPVRIVYIYTYIVF